MDPTLQPRSTTTLASRAKLRLMFSYGGNVVPRLGTKSFCYAGGDTRIIAINREAITSIISLISHLSTALSLQYPFILKYQLPGLDLDSLISITSDDDLCNFVDEYDRISFSSTPARIRLFIFPLSSEYRLSSSSQPYPQSVIDHPKTETWFSDALNSAKILHNEGRRCLMGIEGEGLGESLTRNGGGDLIVGSTDPESVILDTSSSFGSTSSAASLSGLPAIKAQVDDSNCILQDISKFKVASSDSFPSGNTIRYANAYQESLPYQEPVVFVSSGEHKFISEPVQVESIPTDFSFGMQPNKAVANLENFAFIPPKHIQHQQVQVPLVHINDQYIQQNYTAGFPISSQKHLHQPVKPMQQLGCQSNHPQLVYNVPIEQKPAFHLPGQYGFVDNVSVTNQPLMEPNTSFIAPFAPQRTEEGPNVPFLPRFAVPSYSPGVAMDSFVNVPCQQNAAAGVGHMHRHLQAEPDALRESPRFGNDMDEDLARVQIYKSQPPPPPPPSTSRYGSMTKATTVLLSEAYAHMQMQNLSS